MSFWLWNFKIVGSKNARFFRQKSTSSNQTIALNDSFSKIWHDFRKYNGSKIKAGK